ncbi:MAG: NAD(P)H-hydrate epimerase, partial [Phycisphaerales bacterium]
MSIDSPAPTGSCPPALSRRGLRRVDALFAERYALPTIVLMETAGAALARESIALCGHHPRRIAVLCGPGNNGGDGLVAARHLAAAGARVALLLTAPLERFRADAEPNARAVERMGLPLVLAAEPFPPTQAAAKLQSLSLALGGPPTIYIDALLGTGLDRPLDPAHPIAAIIAALNLLVGARTGTLPAVIAADIPSGLDADSGRHLASSPNGGAPAAVRADLTVTFAAPKRGFASAQSTTFTGRVVVESLGIPAALLAEVAADDQPS